MFMQVVHGLSAALVQYEERTCEGMLLYISPLGRKPRGHEGGGGVRLEGEGAGRQVWTA